MPITKVYLGRKGGRSQVYKVGNAQKLKDAVATHSGVPSRTTYYYKADAAGCPLPKTSL